MSSEVLTEQRDCVRVLTINRPEKRNALNTGLIEAILGAFNEADEDHSVNVVLLAAKGPLFSAGIDVNEFRGAGPDAADLAERRSDALLRLLSRFGSLRCPVIAAVNGTAIGAGAALALAADVVVMSKDAKIGYPETKHGFVPSLMVGTLVRNVGRKAAFELLAFGELIDADRALVLGLVNRVAGSGQLADESIAFAKKLSAIDATAVQQTKRLFSTCVDLPLADALRKGRELGRALRKKTR